MNAYQPLQTEQVLDRLRIATESENDAQLARYLGVAQTTVSTWRKRGVIPYEACVRVAAEKGMSLDVFIFGDSLPRGTGLTPIHQELFEICWSLAVAMVIDNQAAWRKAVEIYNSRVALLEKLRGRMTVEDLIFNFKTMDDAYLNEQLRDRREQLPPMDEEEPGKS